MDERSPGPAAYKTMNLDTYKKRLPKYSMSGRSSRHLADGSPGPAAYEPKVPFTSTPKFTFGIKHSEYKGYYAPDEEQV
jgi:hypothetical protein